MKAQCEKCKAEYDIDESRVPPEGLQIKCPRCSATFIVTKGGDVPETAGDLFDLGSVDLSGTDQQESLELDISGEAPPAPQAPPAPAPPKPAGGSTLPPIGGGSSTLPEIPSDSPSPQPTPGSEGQIFDFIEQDIGEEPLEDVAAPTRYRIRRKSGKIFGPFDSETVNKMLAEHQLMGNEEASTDGHNFNPLGSFEEFADTIRLLMEEPAATPGAPVIPPSSVQGVDEGEEVPEMAPKGVEFAEPPSEPAPRKGKHPGAMLFILLGAVLLVVLIGVGLGFTKYGFFGYNLITGSGQTGGGPIETGPDVDESLPASGARQLFFQDTFTGYQRVIQQLEPKLKDDEASLDELYLLGLSCAAMLRNYGANEVYLARGREVVAKMKDEAPDRAETRKVDAAISTLTNAANARQLLDPMVGKDARDKEALFLAGWTMAYQKKWREAAMFFDRATVIDPDYAKAYHALGDIQSLQGDFDNALLFYEKAVEKNPQHINSAVEQARIHIEVKMDDPTGEKILAGVFGEHFQVLSPSEQAKAHYLRAQIHKNRHEKDKTAANLNAAIKLMPSRVDYLAAMGNFLLDIGEFAKAKSMFDQALSKEPKNVDALVGKGRAMWQNGDIVKAKMLLERTAGAAKDDPRPIYLLGRIAEDLEKPEDAMKLYRRATKVAPSYLLARVATARLNLKQGKLRVALDDLSSASKINPRSAVVRSGLGEVYLMQGNLRLAKKEFEEALRLDSELASAHFNLANVLRELGKLDEAIAEYQRVAVISPKYPDMALELGYTLFLKKQYLEALKMYEEAIRDNPKDDRLYVRAGLAANASGETQTAIKYFQSATGLNNTNTNAFFHLADVFQKQNEHEQALELFKRVADLDKKNAEAHYRMGLSLMATEMVTDAIDEFREAIRLKSGHVDALLELGKVLSSRLQFAEAIRHFKRVAREKPKRIDVLVYMGDCYSQQGQYRKALKIFKKAFKKKPKFPGLAYRLGRTYQDLEKRSQAVKYYLKAVKYDPKDPMPHYYLGYVYKAYGHNKKAIAEFRMYLQLRPDAPDADEVKEEMDYLRR
jgi:predicted Zn finger-like uncharacterized protein